MLTYSTANEVCGDLCLEFVCLACCRRLRGMRRFIFSIITSFFSFLYSFRSTVFSMLIFQLRLIQSPVLPPLLFHRTRFPFAHQRILDRRTTLFPFFQFLDFGSQDFASNLLILRARSGSLAFDYDAGWLVDELDGGVCFVLCWLIC